MKTCKLCQTIKKFLLEYANTLLFAVTALGVYIGIYQYTANNQRLREAATVEFTNEFLDILASTDPVLADKINLYGRKNGYIDTDTLRCLMRDQVAYRKQLDYIATALNQFAIGCQKRFFDEETAWVTHSRYIKNAVFALVPYFEIVEQERKYGKDVHCYWFPRNMVRRWELDEYADKYNKKITRLRNKTHRQIKNKKAIIMRAENGQIE